MAILDANKEDKELDVIKKSGNHETDTSNGKNTNKAQRNCKHGGIMPGIWKKLYDVWIVLSL